MASWHGDNWFWSWNIGTNEEGEDEDEDDDDDDGGGGGDGDGDDDDEEEEEKEEYDLCDADECELGGIKVEVGSSSTSRKQLTPAYMASTDGP